MKQCNVCGNKSDGMFCGVCGSPLTSDTENINAEENNEQSPQQSSQNTDTYNSNQDQPYQQASGYNNPYQQSGGYYNPNQPPYQQAGGYYNPNQQPPYSNPQYPPYVPSQKRTKTLPIVLAIVGGILVLCIAAIVAISVVFTSVLDATYYEDDFYGYYDYTDDSWFISNPTEDYEIQLGSGNYVVGVDIPVGVYDLSIESGVGYFESYFSRSYNNYYYYEVYDLIDKYSNTHGYEMYDIMLPEGTVFIVSGMTVNMTSAKAEVSTKGTRSNPLQNEVTLQPGMYAAGKDFESGVYNVVAVEGTGYVESDSYEYSGILNEYFSDVKNGFYINEYKYVEFEDGNVLQTEIVIKLVPGN